MTAWTKFVTKLFRDRSKQNPDYKFKNALKDAAKLYKKGGADGVKEEETSTAPSEPAPETVTESATETVPASATETVPASATETVTESAPETVPESAPETETVTASAPNDGAWSLKSLGIGGKRNSRRNKKGGKKSLRKMKKGGKQSSRKSKGSKKNRA